MSAFNAEMTLHELCAVRDYFREIGDADMAAIYEQLIADRIVAIGAQP